MRKSQLKERLYFIGDIHGQNYKLTNLLSVINFDTSNPESSSAGGQLVFIGDLIDNHPKDSHGHLALLNKVESLVKSNDAFCVMGNHEFNAVGWATKKENGDWARPHTESNHKQHNGFLQAVGENSSEYRDLIDWFKSLPIFLDFGVVRAIHACWDESAIERIKPYLNADNSLKEEHWINAFDETHELYELCEILLKGPERDIDIPFVDKTGKTRTRERIQWWNDSEYKEPTVPTVIGHYTITGSSGYGLSKSGLPIALSNRVVCVDYNAAKDDNPLVCYRFNLATVEQSNSVESDQFYYLNKK